MDVPGKATLGPAAKTCKSEKQRLLGHKMVFIPKENDIN